MSTTAGIGVDVVELKRFKKTIEEFGNRFLEKVFTKSELQYAQSKKNFIQHLAARFAAKEAVAKAMSTGWGGGFRWKDVEVTNDLSGKPSIIVSGKMKDSLLGNNIHVSISHSQSIVVAFAIIENKD